jgi:hypothetical protein
MVLNLLKMKKCFLCVFGLLVFGSTYGQIDTVIGSKSPERVNKTLYDLTHYICNDIPDDYKKVHAIYNWITHNIAYDVASFRKGNFKRYKPVEILLRKKALCQGYSDLFKAMCSEQNIVCETVDGYAKDWKFDNGDHFYKPQHTWNAVLIVSKWYLVDATWGAGGMVQKLGLVKKVASKLNKKKLYFSKRKKFEFEYDSQYCFQDVEEFRIKHLPEDPLWQLTDTIMPIQVFEAGEQSIITFNEKFSKPSQFSIKLNQLSKLDAKSKIIESADRTYDFNKRYKIKKSEKHFAMGTQKLDECYNTYDKSTGKVILKDAKKEIADSRKYLNDQKKDITEEYTTLKEKNREKKKIVTAYKQQIVSTNKKFIAQSKSKLDKGISKKNDLIQKFKTLTNDKSKISIEKIETIKPTSTVAVASELKTIQDSLNARTNNINALTSLLKNKNDTIGQLTASIYIVLDSLALYAKQSDSLLFNVTVARMNMKDSYDDEVIDLEKKIQVAKFENADTLQKIYFIKYDSLIALNESQLKSLQNKSILCKKNLTDIENFKKAKGTDINTLNSYGTNVKQYFDTKQAILALYNNYITLVNTNKPALASIGNLYKQQNKYMVYIKNAEDSRRKVTKSQLVMEEKHDKQLNTSNKELIKKTNTKADKIFTKIHKPKKNKKSKF